MKYKALFVLLLTTMLITPVFAFIHPPPPPPPVVPCPTFGVKINGDWAYEIANPYLFVEPEDSFCTEFTVEVWALNMTDLYGFEFKLVLAPTGYFELLSWVVEDVWPSQLVVINTTDYLSWFKLAVVAKAPSTGVNGDILLVTLTFHIYNDVCYPQCGVSGSFTLHDLKASDSCTKPIKMCGPIPAYWEFIAKKPEVYIEPKEEINCVVGEMVTYSVWVHNITKMKSLHFDLRWKGNHIVNCKEDLWLRILNLTEVIINEDVFPKANRTDSVVIFNDPANKTSKVVVDIVMECTFPLINGTFKAVDLIFEKMDPWWCGRQPEYDIDLKTHEMKPDNATTPLWFEKGWIDVMCPELEYIWFGRLNKRALSFTTFAPGWDIVTDYYPADVTVDIYGDCKVKWIFDMIGDKVLVGDGHWGIDLVIFDCTGPEPLFKIYNNDGANADYPWGTWLYSPWVHGFGFNRTAEVEVTTLAWVSATGERDIVDNPTGIFTVTIEGLGNKFCFAIWVGVGGFWANPDPPPDHNGYSSYPEGFYWGPWNGYWGPFGGYDCVAKASYNEAKFTFMPVPGDLSGDGKVDIDDLTAIASKYGLTWHCGMGLAKFIARYYYDFNKDGIIDIFDIIVVSKNFGAECPF